MQDYSTQTWTKLDAAQLKTTADQFERSVKKLANKLPGAESMSPYIKLRETVTGFKNSLPLIEMLKHPAILERHWKRILEETGKGGGEINPKSLTLSKVFELELQNHEDKVTEICVEAKEEAKNEENMQKIENDWKATSFDIVPYTKKKESGDDNK
jgi:dynein heavy chain